MSSSIELTFSGVVSAEIDVDLDEVEDHIMQSAKPQDLSEKFVAWVKGQSGFSSSQNDFILLEEIINMLPCDFNEPVNSLAHKVALYKSRR